MTSILLPARLGDVRRAAGHEYEPVGLLRRYEAGRDSVRHRSDCYTAERWRGLGGDRHSTRLGVQVTSDSSLWGSRRWEIHAVVEITVDEYDDVAVVADEYSALAVWSAAADEYTLFCGRDVQVLVEQYLRDMYGRAGLRDLASRGPAYRSGQPDTRLTVMGPSGPRSPEPGDLPPVAEPDQDIDAWVEAQEATRAA